MYSRDAELMHVVFRGVQKADSQLAAVGASGALSHRNSCLSGQEDAALYRHLGTLLRHCVMLAAAGDRTEELHG